MKTTLLSIVLLFSTLLPTSINAMNYKQIRNDMFTGSSPSLSSPLRSRNPVQFEFSFNYGRFNVNGDFSDTKGIFAPGFMLSGLYTVQENFQLSAGIGFQQKGFRIKEDIVDQINSITQKQDYKNRFNYLSIPVLARFSNYSIPGMYFNIGPYFNFFMNGTRKGSFTVVQSDGSETNSFDIDEKVSSIKSLEYGILFSALYEVKLIENKRKPSLSLLSGINYQFGLSSIDDSGMDQNIKNSGINLQIGLSLLLP